MARGEKEQNNCCQIFLHTFVYFCNALLDLRKTQVMMKVVNICERKETKSNRSDNNEIKLFRFISIYHDEIQNIFSSVVNTYIFCSKQKSFICNNNMRMNTMIL